MNKKLLIRKTLMVFGLAFLSAISLPLALGVSVVYLGHKFEKGRIPERPHRTIP